MNNYKVFRAMEWFWLAIAGAMALLSIYLLSTSDFDSAKMPLFGTCCATAMYLLRRYQRKKVSSYNAPSSKPDKKG